MIEGDEMINVVKIKAAFEDIRGSIFDIIEGEVRHVGIIKSKVGSVRARHYHKKSTQYTFIISGKVEFFEKKLHEKNAKMEKVILGPFDLVITPPGIYHAIKCIEDCIFLDMTSESRVGNGYEEDTVRVDEPI